MMEKENPGKKMSLLSEMMDVIVYMRYKEIRTGDR